MLFVDVVAAPTADDPGMRPNSFLHDEMSEFDRIFSELFFSPHKRMSLLVADVIETPDVTVSSNSAGGPAQQRLKHDKASESSPCATNSEQASESSSEVATEDNVSRPKVANDSESEAACELRTCDSEQPVRMRRTHASKSTPVPQGTQWLHEVTELTAGAGRAESPPHERHDFSIPAERTRYINDSLKKLKSSVVGNESDKLFTDLLDDLDNISKLDTDSARRRKKARDIFSDWLFNSSEEHAPSYGSLRRVASTGRSDARPQQMRRATAASFEYKNEVGYQLLVRVCRLTEQSRALCYLFQIASTRVITRADGSCHSTARVFRARHLTARYPPSKRPRSVRRPAR